MKTTTKSYKNLKKKFSKLTKEFNVVQKENDSLKKVNERLKEDKAKDLSKVNTSEVNEQLQEEKDLKKDKYTSHYLNCGKFGHLSYDCGDCPKKRKNHQSWYLDSGSSRDMMGESNQKGGIIRIGKHHFPSIDNV
ncbi:hypothetical protein CR513_12076, partial [Mucuna pruriens]